MASPERQRWGWEVVQLLLLRVEGHYPGAHDAGMGRGLWDLRRAAGLGSHLLLLTPATGGPPPTAADRCPVETSKEPGTLADPSVREDR